MGWLAKALIEPESATHQRFQLIDSYGWHRAAWQAFPGLDGQPRPFLSRLDSGPHGFALLLLSKKHRPERPDWCPEECWAVKTIAPEFLHLRHYRFDLHANPTRKVAKFDTDGKCAKNGRRKPITRIDAQIEWVRRKASDSGFSLVGAPDIVSCRDQVFCKGGKNGVHTGVRFRGVLEVTDPPRFEESFYGGIGSAKGFGFGMLLLQRIRM
ncbi:MAG: type I-E CRISPR-associated protein Cas6/Cse3/CasE [Acidobacteriales bacterium]|nr:type I-E CRISPR-associated protein Cas6/Cse3/CasE [Terriglobales bacterium]